MIVRKWSFKMGSFVLPCSFSSSLPPPTRAPATRTSRQVGAPNRVVTESSANKQQHDISQIKYEINQIKYHINQTKYFLPTTFWQR